MDRLFKYNILFCHFYKFEKDNNLTGANNYFTMIS